METCNKKQQRHSRPGKRPGHDCACEMWDRGGRWFPLPLGAVTRHSGGSRPTGARAGVPEVGFPLPPPWQEQPAAGFVLRALCPLRARGSSRCSAPSLREDCRGNTVYVVSSANAGCNQCFNQVLEVKCGFNLLIALRGWQIALYHFFLSCKLIKEYRGAFKWGIAASRTLLVCIRKWAGTAVPLFFCLLRGSECSCGSFLNAYLCVSGAEGGRKEKFQHGLFLFPFAGWAVDRSFSVQWSWHVSSH